MCPHLRWCVLINPYSFVQAPEEPLKDYEDNSPVHERCGVCLTRAVHNLDATLHQDEAASGEASLGTSARYRHAELVVCPAKCEVLCSTLAHARASRNGANAVRVSNFRSGCPLALSSVLLRGAVLDRYFIPLSFAFLWGLVVTMIDVVKSGSVRVY